MRRGTSQSSLALSGRSSGNKGPPTFAPPDRRDDSRYNEISYSSGKHCMGTSIGRRGLLAGAGAALFVGALESCSINAVGTKRGTPPTPTLQLAPLHASPDRITAITVCTRPFRAQGPRLDVEQVGQKTVIHNYGHGGSGWSLSWGSSGIAVQKAVATPNRAEAELAVNTIAELFKTT
jgi:hypothetical protein